MTTANILWLVVGLILGAGIGLLAMCLVAMGKLGDDPLPEIQPERVPPPEEPRQNVRGWTPMDQPGQRRQYQD
ncbi:hypothetical protein [Cupriavidus pinatubonensis]|uniref:hypothetical protein n=1 Tax=Cupriavidus pinatubonensis TaxID=248026 RepID=UPI0036063288